MTGSAARTLTCVVADDHAAMVDVVSRSLTEDGIEVVARARDGAEALAAIRALKPSVAVLAILMPVLGGIEVVRSANRLVPGTATILYAAHPQRDLLVEGLDAGARGFVLKDTPSIELVRAVRLVASGEMYIDPVLAPALLHAGTRAAHTQLSSREREILRFLADGKSNAEIARTLFISPDTVRTYIRRAMNKLEAKTRTQAVAIALRQSFIA
jgi:DNA-binding NarL/FixJ family response regulator